MKKAVFLRLIVTSTLAVLIFSVFLSFMLQARYETGLTQSMLSTVKAAVLSADRTRAPEDLAEALSLACGGLRFTIVLPDGTVAADTQLSVNELDNHYDRPEIVQARAAGEGFAQRYSETLGENYIYVAFKSSENTIYRVSQSVKGIENSIIQILPATAIGILIVLFLSLYAARRTASTVVKPIESLTADIIKIRDGDYTVVLTDPKYEELAPLASSVNALVKSINATLGNLAGEKEKLGFVLDNMKQGLVVVDSTLKILLCNNSAKTLFNNTGHFTGKPFLHLTHNPKIVAAVEDSIKAGVSAIFNIRVDYFDKVYSVSVNRVSAGWVENGAIVIFTDVTQVVKLEQMRREFVANASHELKTPITSISGFAELLASGLIKDEAQVNDYLERIREETARITALLDDILKLSSLEDAKEMRKRETVDLLNAAKLAVKSLKPQADSGNIRVTVGCDTAVISADPEDIRHLLTNLIENAIKYTEPGGEVAVTVTAKSDSAEIMIADTGIGIPERDIPRIFERFYRVDKGRSRSVGGTGLGLSIVKHIVALYAGDIRVKSKVGEGTEIIVNFPLLSE